MFGLDFAAVTELNVKIYHDDDATEQEIARWALNCLKEAGNVCSVPNVKDVEVRFFRITTTGKKIQHG